MVAVRGRFDGVTVMLDKAIRGVPECDVIVTFLEPPLPARAVDDGSLAYLFKDYIDDGIREPLIDFGEAVGNEKW
ncbi:MAG: hypothetical protein LBT00_11310 [Spirochaetaceae bacterium]|jgi:hypothetical protein|nr:hypothetical protein [Spirochaetaceae bacterium]